MSGRPVKRGNQDVNLASSQGLKIGQDEIFFFQVISSYFLKLKARGRRRGRRKFTHSIVRPSYHLIFSIR